MQSDAGSGRAPADRTPASAAADASHAWEALFRAQVAIMRRLAQDDIWGSVSMREYDVLLQLARADDRALRLRDLNETILLSQPSLSRLVERLEERGLVVRDRVPDDARGVSVRLTDEGARVQRETGGRHVRRITRYVGGALSAAELRTLLELCHRLVAAQADIPDQLEPTAREQR